MRRMYLALKYVPFSSLTIEANVLPQGIPVETSWAEFESQGMAGFLPVFATREQAAAWLDGDSGRVLEMSISEVGEEEER